MDKYLLLMFLGGCLLIALCALFFYCRRIERRFNCNIVKCIREQDRLVRELEDARVEKSTLEELLRMKLTEVVETLLTQVKATTGNIPPPDNTRPYTSDTNKVTLK